MTTHLDVLKNLNYFQCLCLQNQEGELEKLRSDLQKLRDEEQSLEQQIESSRQQLNQLSTSHKDIASQVAQVCIPLILFYEQSLSAALSKLHLRLPCGKEPS